MALKRASSQAKLEDSISPAAAFKEQDNVGQGSRAHGIMGYDIKIPSYTTPARSMVII